MKKYKFTIHGNDYDVEIKNFEDNKAEIEVNGSIYEVELKNEIKTSKTPKLVRKSVSPNTTTKPLTRSGNLSTIKAPLPGNILQVLVREGDTVKKEDKLIVLEAMKMENSIMAEKDGVVKKINVSTGDTVLQDDVLITIE